MADILPIRRKTLSNQSINVKSIVTTYYQKKYLIQKEIKLKILIKYIFVSFRWFYL